MSIAQISPDINNINGFVLLCPLCSLAIEVSIDSLPHIGFDFSNIVLPALAFEDVNGNHALFV